MKRRRKKKAAEPKFATMRVELWGYFHAYDVTSTEKLLVTIQAPRPGYSVEMSAPMNGFVVNRVVVTGGPPQ